MKIRKDKLYEKLKDTVSIDLTTKEGFSMFLEDTNQSYIDSIDSLEELSVVALFLSVKIGRAQDNEEYELCAIIKEKLDMIDIRGTELLKQKKNEKN